MDKTNKPHEQTKKEYNMNEIIIKNDKNDPDTLVFAVAKPPPTKTSTHSLPDIFQAVAKRYGRNFDEKDTKNHKELNTREREILLNRQKYARLGTKIEDEDLELDIESMLNQDIKEQAWTRDIIHGNKIVHKVKPQDDEAGMEKPMLFHTTFKKNPDNFPSKKTTSELEEDTRQILCYTLSDRSFIDKGWTMLPTEKVIRKMNIYRMRPAHPELNWFKLNKSKGYMTYDTGEKLAEFEDDGRARCYYRNGRLAINYYDAEETNAQQRYVVYSSGELDKRGRSRPITVLAMFDFLGSGIVFDHSGKIRLKYNQSEGVVLDRGLGPVTHWKWHSLNDPPVLQQVMIDTNMPSKDPTIVQLGRFEVDHKARREDDEQMLAIELENLVKEKAKKLSSPFHPYQIKMKALEINEQFSLRIIDQATIYLLFQDGSVHLKLNLGMILDHREIVDTETVEVGEVPSSLETVPARSDSVEELRRKLEVVQHRERMRSMRKQRIRPPAPRTTESADQMTAATSRPPHTTISNVPGLNRYQRRKPTNFLYYETRLC